MNAKIVYAKTAFSREEVAKAAECADGNIIGFRLVCDVELQMEISGIEEVPVSAFRDSERECIEWGLINRGM